MLVLSRMESFPHRLFRNCSALRRPLTASWQMVISFPWCPRNFRVSTFRGKSAGQRFEMACRTFPRSSVAWAIVDIFTETARTSSSPNTSRPFFGLGRLNTPAQTSAREGCSRNIVTNKRWWCGLILAWGGERLLFNVHTRLSHPPKKPVYTFTSGGRPVWTRASVRSR